MWRETLANIVRSSHERKRIANELGVSPITLMRWISGESKPRPQNLRLLFHALPEYHQQLLELLQAEFGPAFVEEINRESIPYQIDKSFYTQVLHSHCVLPRVVHLHFLSEMILQQALQQLDPNRAGMQATLIGCRPPNGDGVVRSLREIVSSSTYPLKSELERPYPFLGRESLAGQAVLSRQVQIINNRQEIAAHFSAPDQPWKESMIAYPIRHFGYIAGCLLICSPLVNYFQLYSRRELVKQYASLLTLVFDEDTFYEYRKIDLGVMPAYEVQHTLLVSLYHRVADIMRLTPMSNMQAERRALQQIEAELLARSR